MKIELRHMRNGDNEYEDVLRYCQQIKYIKPINSKVLREGVLYVVTSDQLYLKSGTKGNRA